MRSTTRHWNSNFNECATINYLCPDKCNYGYSELDILGLQVIAGQGETTVLSKVEAISNIAVPDSVPTLCTFLGAVGVNLMIIRIFADTAATI